MHCEVYRQLILRKISKIGAIKCQILRLKCAKFHFRWGTAVDPTYSAPQILQKIAFATLYRHSTPRVTKSAVRTTINVLGSNFCVKHEIGLRP